MSTREIGRYKHVPAKIKHKGETFEKEGGEVIYGGGIRLEWDYYDQIWVAVEEYFESRYDCPIVRFEAA